MEQKRLNNSQRKELSVFTLVWAFFKIGLTAFGMAMLQQIKSTLIKNKWLSQREIDEGVAMVQLYPGPLMYNLSIYCSYKLKGFWGSLLSSFFFILPSYVLMVVLSWLYFAYGSVAWVKPIFLALDAMVVGIVFHIFLGFGKRYVNSAVTGVIAGTAFLLLLYHVNGLIIIAIAIILEYVLGIFFKDRKQEQAKEQDTVRTVLPGSLSSRLVGIIVTGVVFVGIIIWGLVDHSQNAQLSFSMFKIGAVAFGSGFTIMPLLQQTAVSTHHWLTMRQFADGIAFGQITPGPILITATFVGYKVGGLTGSALATFAMFFPSFFYTLIVTEIYEKIRTKQWIQRSIHAIMSAFTGMLAWVVLSLGQVSLGKTFLFIWAVGSFILVRYFKINILWIFLFGILARLLMFFVLKY